MEPNKFNELISRTKQNRILRHSTHKAESHSQNGALQDPMESVDEKTHVFQRIQKRSLITDSLEVIGAAKKLLE